MKITWSSRDAVGRFAFTANAENYDAVAPVNRLILDRDMLVVNDETFSLSAFLAFAPYIGAEISLPKRVSPEVAAAMQRFIGQEYLHVNPVDFEPFAAPSGDGMLFVDCNDGPANVLPNLWGRPRNSTISILDSSKWGGYLISTDHIKVASNARVLADLGERRYGILPFISVALLFMESMKTSMLVVADDAFDNEEEFIRVADLMGAGKFGLLRESEALSMLQREAERSE